MSSASMTTVATDSNDAPINEQMNSVFVFTIGELNKHVDKNSKKLTDLIKTGVHTRDEMNVEINKIKETVRVVRDHDIQSIDAANRRACKAIDEASKAQERAYVEINNSHKNRQLANKALFTIRLQMEDQEYILTKTNKKFKDSSKRRIIANLSSSGSRMS